MAARFVATTRLANIVEMIRLAQQSGILRVVRGHGTDRELGQVRFVEGDPVAALLGRQTGAQALNILANWGECAYAFDEGAESFENDTGSWESDPFASSPVQSSPAMGLSSGSWPSYGSYPLGSNTPSQVEFSQGGSQPGMPQQAYPHAPGAPMREGGAQPRMVPGGASSPSPEGMRPDLLRAVPRRTRVADQVEQLPLDRRERMVLLLVDGQRTVSDLTRLTRRNEQEIYAVLNHLVMLGLISFSA